jgi:hypothetical protein
LIFLLLDPLSIFCEDSALGRPSPVANVALTL